MHPILAIVLIYDSSNRPLIDDLNKAFPAEAATAKLLRMWIPTTKLDPIRTLIGVVSYNLPPELHSILFRNNVTALMEHPHLKQLLLARIKNCYWLLP